MRTLLTLSILVGLSTGAPAQQTNRQAETESYDISSPEVPGVSPSDIVVVNSTMTGGGGVQWSALQMGLPPGANIDGFSDGTDILPPLPPVQCRTVYVEYTVDRAAVGAPGGLIEAQSKPGANGAASDTFGLQLSGGGKTYYLASDGLAVTPRTGGGPTETDLDALAWLERSRWPVYFSLDGPSALLFGVSPGDVLTSSGNATSTLHRSALSLGLSALDDIDALAVSDSDGSIVLSVTQGSPANTSGPFAGFAGAGLLKNAGALVGYLSPAELTLLPTDELDGVRITDPGSFESQDGTEIDDITSFPWEMIRIEGTGGNIDHVVEVAVGQPFGFEMRPKNPAAPYACLYTPGRPCLCNELPIGIGTLAIGGFDVVCPGHPIGVLFVTQGPLQFVTQVNIPLEVTLQAVLGPGFVQHTSNALTLRVN